MEILLGVIGTLLGQYIIKLVDERIKGRAIKSDNLKFLISERQKQLSNLPIKSTVDDLMDTPAINKLFLPHPDYKEKARLEGDVERLYKELEK